MSDEQETAFLSAIRENPDDDAPRLIYADWLEEQGDQAKTDRADFIRLQCRLEKLPYRPVLAAREVELLEAHQEEWERPLRDLGATAVEFRRGFPHHIAITPQAFLDHAEQLFALAPIRSVRITDATPGQVQTLAGSPHLRNLTTLDLEDNVIGDTGAAALARSPRLRNLTTLHLGRNAIFAGGAAALAGSPHLRNLTTLDLGDNVIGDAGAEALSASEHLGNLTDLNLRYNAIGAAGAAALARSEHLHNLTTLNLRANDIPQTTLDSIAQVLAGRRRSRQQ